MGSSLEPRGLVEVFTGNGRGKTSAAMGVALRALGHGFKVFVVFFMKGGYPHGEQEALARFPNATVAVFGLKGFVDPRSVTDAERTEARRALAAGREAVLSGAYDVVVLDEVNVAAAWKLVPLEEVLDVVRRKPEKVELIMTGRYAAPELIQAADLVTELMEVKHPYQQGIPARRGIDY